MIKFTGQGGSVTYKGAVQSGVKSWQAQVSQSHIVGYDSWSISLTVLMDALDFTQIRGEKVSLSLNPGEDALWTHDLEDAELTSFSTSANQSSAGVMQLNLRALKADA